MDRVRRDCRIAAAALLAGVGVSALLYLAQFLWIASGSHRDKSAADAQWLWFVILGTVVATQLREGRIKAWMLWASVAITMLSIWITAALALRGEAWNAVAAALIASAASCAAFHVGRAYRVTAPPATLPEDESYRRRLARASWALWALAIVNAAGLWLPIPGASVPEAVHMGIAGLYWGGFTGWLAYHVRRGRYLLGAAGLVGIFSMLKAILGLLSALAVFETHRAFLAIDGAANLAALVFVLIAVVKPPAPATPPATPRARPSPSARTPVAQQQPNR